MSLADLNDLHKNVRSAAQNLRDNMHILQEHPEILKAFTDAKETDTGHAKLRGLAYDLNEAANLLTDYASLIAQVQSEIIVPWPPTKN